MTVQRDAINPIGAAECADSLAISLRDPNRDDSGSSAMAYQRISAFLGVSLAAGFVFGFLPACSSSDDRRWGDGSDGSGTGGSADDGTGGAVSASGGTMSTNTGGSSMGTGGSPEVEHPDPLTTGCDGWASRYWDCCKPHCAWQANAGGAGSPMRMCSRQNQTLSNADAPSACAEPSNNAAGFVCYDNAPWAVSDTLAYGYVATHGGAGDHCGRCFQFQFKGSSHNAGDDAGSQALQGKTMIVQATNIGYDVSGDGQFDLMLPGGGLGAFQDACPVQWGVSAGDLGAGYGGLLTTCKSQHGNNHTAVKNCVRQRCQSLFGSKQELSALMDACDWFVDWYEVADNPSFLYKEVPCPQALIDRTSMDRRSANDVQNNCGG